MSNADAPGPAPSVTATARRLLRAAERRVRRRPPPLGRPDTSWVRAEDAPAVVEPLAAFRFFAVLGTWFEADVVGATVRNAFEQGCERVYLVDNDSPDDTVAVATGAGAIPAASFVTDDYDEHERMRVMQDVVDSVSAATADEEGATHIWWLWLDADEFPHGPAGRTLSEHLASLDARYRVVGARWFNHYPDRLPEYETGHHPLPYQPLCEELAHPMCDLGHRKHPLQRWDADGPPITCGAGFHMASCVEQLVEPTVPVYEHHFPFRVEAVSRARLDVLCGPDGARATDPETAAHMQKRYRQLDDVYRHRWNRVERLAMDDRSRGVHLLPWPDLVDPADARTRTF